MDDTETPVKEENCNNNGEKEKKKTVTEKIVTIHVSGATYELDLEDIRRAQSSRLYKCVFVGNNMSMTFKRPRQSFEAVLAYYQTGELHMPMSVCPGAFKTELEFWGIDPQIMTKCCYYRYMSHLDDQETLDKFHLHLFPEVGIEKRPLRCLQDFRARLWKVVDNIDYSIVTKLYFYLCTLMVILSVLTLAFSTLPYFRRNLTKCEVEDLLGESVKTVNFSLGNLSCSDPLPDNLYAAIIVDYDKVKLNNETELKEGDILINQPTSGQEPAHANDSGNPDDQLSRSLFDFKFDEEDTVSDEAFVDHIYDALRPRFGIGKKTVRVKLLVYLDTGLLAFFAADLLFRVFSCPSIRRYFLSTINVIDALVVLSAFAHMAIKNLQSEKYEATGFDILEILQVLRVVRLLRVVRNVTGFKVLSFSLKVSVKDLLVLFLYLLLGIAIFANFIFFVESDNDIRSIPDGWWWAINTLTTVGYGDMVPYTVYGRLIGALCAISGVVMMAVAIPIFVKTFMLLYAYAVLYKKSINRPEVCHQYIHRQGAIKRPEI